jgi:hypothetical protein
LVQSDRAFAVAPAPSGGDRLGATGLYAEFAKYAPTEPDYSYKCVLGGGVVLARFAAAALVLSSEIELIAEPRSAIGFNPRAFYWSESLAVAGGAGAWAWSAGYVHRCKHDVENLRFLRIDGFAEQRSLIFDSLSGRLFWKALSWLDLSAKADLYLVLLDDAYYRTDASAAAAAAARSAAVGAGSLDSLLASAALGALIGGAGTAGGPYLRLRAEIAVSGGAAGWTARWSAPFSAETDLYAEIGWILPGSIRLAPFLAVERQADGRLHAYPVPAGLLYFGLKLSDPRLYR